MMTPKQIRTGRMPPLVVMGIPFAITGGILALLVRGLRLSISAGSASSRFGRRGVVIGGLVRSTVLTLLVLPTLPLVRARDLRGG